jgi:osmotically-inducible protein OsmY
MKRTTVPIGVLLCSLVLSPLLAEANLASDQRISDQVQLSVASDAEVKGGVDLSVTVHKGVVTIYGRVESQEAKNKATKVAKRVKGVVSVKNDMTVGPL